MIVFFTKNCGFFFPPPKRSVPVVRSRWKCCVMLFFGIKTLGVFSSVDGFVLLIPALWDVFNGSGNPSVCDTQRGSGGEAVWGSGPPREWKVTPILQITWDFDFSVTGNLFLTIRICLVPLWADGKTLSLIILVSCVLSLAQDGGHSADPVSILILAPKSLDPCKPP